MPTPPRIPHLLSVPFLAELLAPSYASANRREAAEVYDELKAGLAASRLHAPLCDAVWTALKRTHAELDDASLTELVAKATARKGGVRAKPANKAAEEAMGALFASIDLQIGRASDAVRQVLETSAGQAARDKALTTAAAHLIGLLKL